jgi:hypothetical protein
MIEVTIRLPRDPAVPDTIARLTMTTLNIGGTLTVSQGFDAQVTGEVGIGDIVAQSRQATPPDGEPVSSPNGGSKRGR